MTALALLSDVHANLEALEACLAHAKGAGATRYAFLGDLVGYGADPAAVVDVVREYVAQGAIAVQGNHDAAAAGMPSGMNDAAAEAIRWTRTALDAEALGWLAALPLCVREGPISASSTPAPRAPRAGTTSTSPAARRRARRPPARSGSSAATCTARCSSSRPRPAG